MDWKNYFSCVLKGLIGSIAVTVILTAILSLFMTFVEISESMFEWPLCCYYFSWFGIWNNFSSKASWQKWMVSWTSGRVFFT